MIRRSAQQQGSSSPSSLPTTNGTLSTNNRGAPNSFSNTNGSLDRSHSYSKIKQRQRGHIFVLAICVSLVLGSAFRLATRLFSSTDADADSSTLTRPTVSTSSGGIEYHIVFSTGCSLYQDWQSYVFFFQAMMAKQPGTVTRIVSGCEPEDEQKMAEQFANEIHPMAPGRFQIHFTPDYSKTPSGKTFVYWSTCCLFPDLTATPDVAAYF